MKSYLMGILLMLFVSTGYSQEKKTDYSDAFRIIEVWLDVQKDYEQLPGISATIIEDQDILWSSAFGLANVEQHVRSEPC